MLIQRRTFLAMTAFCLSGIRAHAAEDIVGIWTSETQDNQENHLQLAFTSTEASLIIGKLTERQYEIDGNMIAIGPVPEPGLPVLRPVPVPFSIDGAALTIAYNPDPLVMMRVDDHYPGMHPIVGSWIYEHPAGVAAVHRFAPSGAKQIVLMLGSDHGTYRLDNGMLTMQFENGPIAVRIKREGNVLIATGSNGRPERFVRLV